MKIDSDRCQGHGVCKLEAPEVFDLDPDTNRATLLREPVDEAQRDAVERAVRYCPTFALSLEG